MKGSTVYKNYQTLSCQLLIPTRDAAIIIDLQKKKAIGELSNVAPWKKKGCRPSVKHSQEWKVLRVKSSYWAQRGLTEALLSASGGS